MNKTKIFNIILLFFLSNFFLISENALELYQKGKDEYFKENYDQAIFFLKKSIENNPNYLEPNNDLANLYLKNNKLLLAKKTLDNVLKTDPNNFNAINLIARYYENTNKDKAESNYLLNIDKNSLNPDT